jgi:hypothetical protein
MEALRLSDLMWGIPSQGRPVYVASWLDVSPNPPLRGQPATISIALTNPGPDPIVVERVAFQLASYGIGVQWEDLPTLGPITVPPNPERVETLAVQWTPSQAGHRCVKATVELAQPEVQINARCNLTVIEAAADEIAWRVPFHIGNPTQRRAPMVLAIDSGDAATVARVLVEGRPVAPGRPIRLEPDEVRAAEALIRALPGETASVHELRIEGFLDGQFLDGIAIRILQPAYLALDSAVEPEPVSVGARA